MKIKYQTTFEQKQILSQTQIQALEILAMDNVELNSFLQNEYWENPILEHQTSKEVPDSMEIFTDWYDKCQSRQGYEEYSGNDDNDDRYENEVAPTEEKSKIREFLIGQLDLKKYTSTEQNLMDYLINCLDDNGFFTIPIMEISRANKITEDLVIKCLEDLRQLEPYGIFAEDLPHCLLRQLEVLEIEDENINKIILYYLNEVGDGKISSISRTLKLTTLQVRKYISMIGGLNPKPLAGFHVDKTNYIVPDIIFRLIGGEWDVLLNDNWIGEYKLNDYYMRLLNETKDIELFEYFKAKIERARFIMNSIEKRRNTLLGIGKALLDLQDEFFRGNGNLKPMIMADLSDKVGIHVSTVSRCVKGKYLQYPKGTISIKSLFSSAVSGDGENEEGTTANEVKRLIKKFVFSEDKKKPYSDQSLTKLLSENNINVSRRAVAKYRDEIGIKGSFARKDF